MQHPEPDHELDRGVRAALPSLFDRGARVVFHERLPGKGNAQILLRVLDLEFWIIQAGGTISVLVAPSYAGDNWEAVEARLRAIEPEDALPAYPVYGSLAELGQLLESRLLRLNAALTEEGFAASIRASRQAKMEGLIDWSPHVNLAPKGRGIAAKALRSIAKVIPFPVLRPRDSWIKTLPIGSDYELEQQVRDEFESVFSDFGAQISSNERLIGFANVSFDAANLRIRASRRKAFIEVSVAPLHAVRMWHRLGIAVQSLQENAPSPFSIPSSMLHGAGTLLRRDFQRLSDAFCEASYPAVQRRLCELERSAKEK